MNMWRKCRRRLTYLVGNGLSDEISPERWSLKSTGSSLYSSEIR